MAPSLFSGLHAMKPFHSAFRELVGECRELAKLRRDVRVLGSVLRPYVQASRAFRFYWFTRCMEGAK